MVTWKNRRAARSCWPPSMPSVGSTRRRRSSLPGSPLRRAGFADTRTPNPRPSREVHRDQPARLSLHFAGAQMPARYLVRLPPLCSRAPSTLSRAPGPATLRSPVAETARSRTRTCRHNPARARTGAPDGRTSLLQGGWLHPKELTIPHARWWRPIGSRSRHRDQALNRS